MKKFSTLLSISLLMILFSQANLRAQTNQTIYINYVAEPVVIDGCIEELWDAVEAVEIEKPFPGEQPTLTAFWKAMYDDNYLYIIVDVYGEESHWPGWKSGGDPLEYDMPVIFLDVNEELQDGKGVKDSGTGHYWFAEGFTEGMYDTPIQVEATDYCPGGTIAYSLGGGENENNYVYEWAIPFANLKDKYGRPMSYPYDHPFGFDVTIIDQDEGKTTAPLHMVWQNDDIEGGCWENMDRAGCIDIVPCCVPFDFFVSSHYETLSWLDGWDNRIVAKIEVYSGNNWTATSDKSWLTVFPDSGTYYQKLTLIADENNTGSERMANITVCENDSATETIMVVQEANPVSVNSNINKENIIIHPNPANEYISLNGFDGKAFVRLSEINGKTVFSKEVKTNEKIEISKLTSGFYIAVIETRDQCIMQKFLKTN
ncbi:MAG: T9SS type A sorting domain-containing protein [Prolixibacteraceae bacterium]|nr:T9SS type A sorting domain-containing protein [Prolixibacteraceae bacterium]